MIKTVRRKERKKVKIVKVTQSCPTLCDPMDYIVHEILRARILKWVAVPIYVRICMYIYVHICSHICMYVCIYI